jgi:hypothetical protein
MSDPIRWSASAGGAPEGVRELLRQAAPPKALDAAARARHAAAIAKVSAGAAAPGAAAAGAKLTLGAKLLAGVGLATAVAVGAVPAVRARMAERATATATARARAARHVAASATPRGMTEFAATTEPAAPEVAPVEVAPVEVPTTSIAAAALRRTTRSHPRGAVTTRDAPSATAPAVGPAPAVDPTPTLAVVNGATLAAATSPAPPESALSQENRLVEAARAARGDRPQEALALADRHAREFPEGQQADAREFVAVQALRDLGRTDEARARARALLARFPDSTYGARTRRILDALP